ncbi:hypothetical protein D3C78_1606330 [compost metagenome]
MLFELLRDAVLLGVGRLGEEHVGDGTRVGAGLGDRLVLAADHAQKRRRQGGVGGEVLEDAFERHGVAQRARSHVDDRPAGEPRRRSALPQ